VSKKNHMAQSQTMFGVGKADRHVCLLVLDSIGFISFHQYKASSYLSSSLDSLTTMVTQGEPVVVFLSV